MSKKEMKTVFLHGFMGDATDWEGLAPHLSDRIHPVFIDLPGHGAQCKNLPRSFNAVIEWLYNQFHREAPFNMVGYSMGGRIAMSFATAYPECVNRLVLESANPGLSDFPERKRRLKMDNVMAARLKNEPYEVFVHDWYTAPIFSSLQNKPEILDAMKERRLRHNPRVMAHLIQTMSPGRQPDCHPFLTQTNSPILAIAGATDTKYSALAREIKGKAYEVAIFENAGHTVHVEQPELYAQHVVDFLTREDE